MTPSELVSVLHHMGVRCVSPCAGRVKLLVDSGAVPQSAIDLAKPLKTELANYLNSQPGLMFKAGGIGIARHVKMLSQFARCQRVEDTSQANCIHDCGCSLHHSMTVR